MENAESIDFPLHDAAKRGNLSFLQECLKHHVSVNSLDKSGSTPLYWAAHSGHVDVMKTLLDVSNVNVNAQNKLGDTALHAAAWKGHASCAELLLTSGANVWIRNIEKKTPLDLATNPAAAALLKRASTAFAPQDIDEYAESDEEADD